MMYFKLLRRTSPCTCLILICWTPFAFALAVSLPTLLHLASCPGADLYGLHQPLWGPSSWPAALSMKTDVSRCCLSLLSSPFQAKGWEVLHRPCWCPLPLTTLDGVPLSSWFLSLPLSMPPVLSQDPNNYVQWIPSVYYLPPYMSSSLWIFMDTGFLLTDEGGSQGRNWRNSNFVCLWCWSGTQGLGHSGPVLYHWATPLANINT